MIGFVGLSPVGSLTGVVAMAQAQTTPVTDRSPVPGAPAGVTAFVDVNVIPMDSARVLPHQTVLIEHGWITALGPTDKVSVPAGAARIDGQGKYLIPGLSDMHLHTPSYRKMLARGLDEPFSDDAMREAEDQLFLELANGVTLVRIMNGRPGTLALRERAARGELPSPRLLVASPAINNSFAPDSAVRLVQMAKRAGYDLIKMYSGDSTWDSTVAAAHRLGMPIAGHAPKDKRGIEGAIHAGYRSIEHFIRYDDYLRAQDSMFRITIERPEADSFQALGMVLHQWSAKEDTSVRALAAAMRKANVWYCPTTVAMFDLGYVEASPAEWIAVNEGRDRFEQGSTALSVFTPAQRDSLLDSFAAKELASPDAVYYYRLNKGLYDGGVKMLLGTDDGTGSVTPLIPGFGVHQELAEFVASGLTPYQALVIGTRNAVEFAGWLDSAGTVTVGKRADLVLLGRNPLQNIRATRQPAGVMIGGRWLDRAALDARLHALEGTIGENP